MSKVRFRFEGQAMLAEFIRSLPDVSREMVLGAICTLRTGEPRESKEYRGVLRHLDGFMEYNVE